MVPRPIISDIGSRERQWNYHHFPNELNQELFGQVREPPVLVTEEDLNEQPSMHISWMSLEFFRQKRLYDRHWHSLQSRIASQNDLFQV